MDARKDAVGEENVRMKDEAAPASVVEESSRITTRASRLVRERT